MGVKWTDPANPATHPDRTTLFARCFTIETSHVTPLIRVRGANSRDRNRVVVDVRRHPRPGGHLFQATDLRPVVAKQSLEGDFHFIYCHLRMIFTLYILSFKGDFHSLYIVI